MSFFFLFFFGFCFVRVNQSKCSQLRTLYFWTIWVCTANIFPWRAEIYFIIGLYFIVLCCDFLIIFKYFVHKLGITRWTIELISGVVFLCSYFSFLFFLLYKNKILLNAHIVVGCYIAKKKNHVLNVLNACGVSCGLRYKRHVDLWCCVDYAMNNDNNNWRQSTYK